jgi:enterochelin esterase-like enzyme
MYNRQATQRRLRWFAIVIPLLFGLWACSPSNQPLPTPTFVPPTETPTTVPPLPTLPSITLTPTPLTCLSQPGELQDGEVATEGRPTAFIIYLPPCYDQLPDEHYPVLYLLNGQTYTADQWVRLGAPEAADELIHSGKSVPFIMVFPEDLYWNLQQGTRFGQYMLNDIIPFIDGNFRTLPDRAHRAIGGLSRGGGWAFQLGMTHADLFSSLGLHSPAIFGNDRAKLDRLMREMPPELWPRIYLDVGDNDRERDFNIHVEEVLTAYEVPHEWHLNNGAHDEAYWGNHVVEYIQWYADGWPLP